MFFKKKLKEQTIQDSQNIQNTPAVDFNEEGLLARLVGLECSLSAELKSVLGQKTWQERIAGVKISPSTSVSHREGGAEGGSEEGLRVTCEFFSDGLGLSEKVMCEDFIVAEMGRRYPQVKKWLVYMKRREPLPQTAQSQTPPQKATPQQMGNNQAVASEKQPQKLAGSKKAIPGVKRIIAVASGKGGVGKSTVSVNLAVSLYNQGYAVGILDADIYGPSIPMMLGITDDPQVNEKNKIIPPERNGIKAMSFGFFAGEDSAVIWRGPMIMKALQQFFYDVDWGNLDFLVIDLPPGTGDAQLTLVQSLPVDGSVIVTTPQNVALLDAVKGVVMFQKTDVPVLGVIENMSTFHCPSCGEEHHIFGEGGAAYVSDKYKIPLLGQIPLNSTIRAAGDSGQPLCFQEGHPVRIRFAEIAEKIVARLIESKRESAEQKISPLLFAKTVDKNASRAPQI